ncbi:MAG: hypothetical protein R3A10_18625 [Caldilineaceae bacterium]
MGVGVLFGVMAGIPTALLLLASNRRRQLDDDWQSQEPGPGPTARHDALRPVPAAYAGHRHWRRHDNRNRATIPTAVARAMPRPCRITGRPWGALNFYRVVGERRR